MAKKKRKKQGKKKGQSSWQAKKANASSGNGGLIEYHGPRQFKSMFEQMYLRMRGDYDRKRPRIVVGIPLIYDDSKLALLGSAFISLEEMIELAQQQLDVIEKIIRAPDDFGDVPLPVQEEKALFDAVNKLDKVALLGNSALNMSALYDSLEDVVYVDIGKALNNWTELVTGRSFAEHTPNEYGVAISDRHVHDVERDLHHELVHNDVGLCIPFVQFREASQPSISLHWYGRTACEMAKKGTEAFCAWYITTPKNEEYEALAKTGEITWERIAKKSKTLAKIAQDIFNHMRRLNINFLNEALAYGYCGARSGFKNYVTSEHGDVDKAMQAYDKLQRNIETNGKIITLRLVKEVINRSYEQDQDALDSILAA